MGPSIRAPGSSTPRLALMKSKFLPGMTAIPKMERM